MLDREVLVWFRAEIDEERVEHVETTRLHLTAMRQMLARLQPKPHGAGK
jgi:F-type H+-transporting ATPase subunit epsilon